MKTSISLSDDLFEAAERQAKRDRTSRRELYAQALTEFLARHAADEATDSMNRVIGRVAKSEPDPLTRAAARMALERIEW